MASKARAGVPVKIVALAALGYTGGAMCITLLFLGMRTVMDIGGYCAEGGPYVIAQGCPDAAMPSLFLGIFGLFLFGAIATGYGIQVGGIWAGAPLLGWSALFGVLGWNFLEYGLIDPPLGQVDWGWVICGVMFWLMAAGPLIALLPLGAALRTAPSDVVANRQARKEAKVPYEPDPSTGTVIRIIGPDGVRVVPADDPEAQEQLAAIAAAMEAALDKVEEATPALVSDASTLTDPGVVSADGAGPGMAAPDGMASGMAAPDGPEFGEGTQALLDRLERLADMRDRGLLEPAEYETAKDAIVRELETRQ